MARIESFLVLPLIFCGCSSKPANSERAGDPATQAAQPNSAFDFGAADLSPASGTGSEATFRVTIKPGSQRPSLVGLLINANQNGADACYVFRNLVSSDNMLVADSGAGALPLGNQKSVANRQCELLREGTDSTESPSGIVLTFHVRFRPEFRGTRQIWIVPEDGTGKGPEMKLAGSWIIP